MNKDLIKLQKQLKDLFTYSKTEDILVVSMDKTELPFAYVLKDDVNYPNKLLISYSVDMASPTIAACLALEVDKIKEAYITESFYISQNGVTYWDDEAFKMFEIDNLVDLESMDSISEELN